MKYILHFIALCLLLSATTACYSQTTVNTGQPDSAFQTIDDTVAVIISDVKSRYCPDRRVSVFDINTTIRSDSILLTGEVMQEAAKEELVNIIQNIRGYTLVDQIDVLPDSASRLHPYGIIRISVAQLRKEPRFSSELVSQAIMGDKIQILKSGKRHYYYCQMGDGYLGWMSRSVFITGDESFIKNWQAKEKLVVVSMYCQVKMKKNDRSDPVSDVVRGNRLIFVKSHRKWYEVELPDGRTGFVRSKYVMKEDAFKRKYPLEAKSITQTAVSLTGTPYLWGGNSVKGLDCSGFTQSVFGLHGILLPRDANMQVHEGTEVSTADNFKHLKPCDLLFFGPQSDRITHVGIYLGNYQFIHSSGMVKIDSFEPDAKNFNEFRLKRLRAVRRILE